MPFTAQELEEMRRADEEIEREFRLTQEEIEMSRRRDRQAVFEALPVEKRKAAAQRKAYYEANREKAAAYQKAYYEANREKAAARNKAYREANREKMAAQSKAYREANREKMAAQQKWIADARKAKGYTQTDAARMIGTSQTSIALLESGRMNLERFAKREELEALLK